VAALRRLRRLVAPQRGHSWQAVSRGAGAAVTIGGSWRACCFLSAAARPA